MSGSQMSELFPVILILIGAIFTFLSAVGMIRLPDVYTRAHAASKSTTLGVLFTLIGTFLFFVFERGFFSIRIFLGIFFVFLTAPVSAHVICRSAYRSNVKMVETSSEDALGEAIKKGQL